MGQGQDKIASSLIDLQPTAIVEFFELEFNTVDKPNEKKYFHGGGLFEQPIKWKGIEYLLIPVESEGFEVTANGQLPRPKIRISNKGYFFTSLLLNNHDFQFAKLTRRRTFVQVSLPSPDSALKKMSILWHNNWSLIDFANNLSSS